MVYTGMILFLSSSEIYYYCVFVANRRVERKHKYTALLLCTCWVLYGLLPLYLKYYSVFDKT